MEAAVDSFAYAIRKSVPFPCAFQCAAVAVSADRRRHSSKQNMEKNKKEVEAKLLFWIISLRSMAMARREFRFKKNGVVLYVWRVKTEQDEKKSN